MQPRRLPPMITIMAVWASVILSFAAHGQSFVLASSSSVNTNDLALQGSEMHRDEPIPVIEMKELPMRQVIEALCRQEGINYIIDKRLMDWWLTGKEPMVNIYWTNLTAQAALLRLLKEHHLALLDDPVTSVARVTYPNQTLPVINPSWFGRCTNIIPLIDFQEAPLTVCVENLARQAGVNYILDPRIGYGLPDSDGRFKPEPVINLHWQNITAKKALIALYQNTDWTIDKDPASSILLIRAKNHPAFFVDVTLLPNDAGITPGSPALIEFQDVPLTVAFENLARQMNFNYRLDPDIGYGQEDKDGNYKVEPMLSIRWENVTAREAFISLCENYNFVIINDPVIGVEVKSDE